MHGQCSLTSQVLQTSNVSKVSRVCIFANVLAHQIFLFLGYPGFEDVYRH